MSKHLLIPLIGLCLASHVSAQESASWYDAIQGVEYPTGVDPAQCSPTGENGEGAAAFSEEGSGAESRGSRLRPPPPRDGERGRMMRGHGGRRGGPPGEGGGGQPPTEEERAARRAEMEERLASMTEEERAAFHAEHEQRRAEMEARFASMSEEEREVFRAQHPPPGREHGQGGGFGGPLGSRGFGGGFADDRGSRRSGEHRGGEPRRRPIPPPHPDSGRFEEWRSTTSQFPGVEK